MATATRKNKTAVPKKRLTKTKRQIETVEDQAETIVESAEQVGTESAPGDAAAQQLGSVAEAEQEDALAAKLDKQNQRLQKIEAAAARVRSAKAEFNASREETKDLKKAWEGAVDALERTIRDANDPQLPLPLKDGETRDPADQAEMAKIDGKAAASAAARDAWRAVKLETLDMPERVVLALHDANVDTMGQLADYTLPQNGNKRLTDIKGIGAKAVELIEEATSNFWSNWTPPEVEAVQPEESAGDPIDAEFTVTDDDEEDAETDEDVEDEDEELGE